MIPCTKLAPYKVIAVKIECFPNEGILDSLADLNVSGRVMKDASGLPWRSIIIHVPSKVGDYNSRSKCDRHKPSSVAF